ncbi:hydroxymethylglutaryl-CoA lyase [Desulfofundulus thermocisternus]|uniref:hydroxymethylglutaryl-CoA lyase n=1 Tax=Desulfofundulus thermocisternus TaxID=42471 RepID=UPI0019DE9253|nr:hydroxymethylglutaryl-CoA lyase [Desulfofundulus thermocisternus]MBE3585309.1 hydroxymethylglutaryl-CoA lyase [Thermoanaerobacter sp.]MCS5695134.1 hydroxymethylglutaryl-CoA lyase [Desulfofundulus thermocisternus]
MLQWPAGVLVREVGPRDGLQNEPRTISTNQKIRLIELLARAGVRAIEATSFVHPRAVPQMADAEEVISGARRVLAVLEAQEEVRGVVLSALAGNRRGVERALAAGVDEVVMVVSASEEHNRANMRMSIGQSLRQVKEAVALAMGTGVVIRGAVAVAFGCPYRGEIRPGKVREVVGALAGAGIKEITLADTAGLANPRQVYELVNMLCREYPAVNFALHFHDARGMALANIVTGIQAGVKIIESSVGGLGGCPFIPGAAGNVATEDVVYMLQRMGIETAIDRYRLEDCISWLEEILGRKLRERKPGCSNSTG